ncbi:MAG: oxidoreductase, partial [Pseudomonadota bacterium]
MTDALASLRGVSRTYQKGKESVEVLHELDLDIPEGDFAAIM